MDVKEAKKYLLAETRVGCYLNEDGKPGKPITLYYVNNGWITESEYLRLALKAKVTGKNEGVA